LTSTHADINVCPMGENFTTRRQRFAALLGEKGLDGALVIHEANLRYFTGFSGGEGVFLCLPPDELLLVDPRYTLRAKEECGTLPVSEAVRPLEDAARIIRRKRHRRIGLETAHLTVDLFRKIKRLLAEISVRSLKDHLDQVRMLKDEEEIRRIEKAIEIHTRALEETLAWLTPDVTEREWAVEFEYRARRGGADRLSFETIVASGPRSAAPHALADPVPLAEGAPVVFDHGVVWGGYCSDETVTFFTGEPSRRFRSLFQVVREAHDAAIEAVRPGRQAREIDAAARDVIVKAGYGDYFTHSTGHGVGLEVHEKPAISARDTTRLAPGMIFTVEPGIYVTGEGGIRIEDMILVTETGCRVLTKRAKSLTVLF